MYRCMGCNIVAAESLLRHGYFLSFAESWWLIHSKMLSCPARGVFWTCLTFRSICTAEENGHGSHILNDRTHCVLKCITYIPLAVLRTIEIEKKIGWTFRCLLCTSSTPYIFAPVLLLFNIVFNTVACDFIFPLSRFEVPAMFLAAQEWWKTGNEQILIVQGTLAVRMLGGWPRMHSQNGFMCTTLTQKVKCCKIHLT